MESDLRPSATEAERLEFELLRQILEFRLQAEVAVGDDTNELLRGSHIRSASSDAEAGVPLLQWKPPTSHEKENAITVLVDPAPWVRPVLR